jgi:hypothetical protein
MSSSVTVISSVQRWKLWVSGRQARWSR